MRAIVITADRGMMKYMHETGRAFSSFAWPVTSSDSFDSEEDHVERAAGRESHKDGSNEFIVQACATRSLGMLPVTIAIAVRLRSAVVFLN